MNVELWAQRPIPKDLALPDPSATIAFGGQWKVVLDGSGAISQDLDVFRSGDAAIRLEGTQGDAGLFLDVNNLVPVEAGQRVRLKAWLRLNNATGRTFMSIDGYEGHEFRKNLAESQHRKGNRSWARELVEVAISPKDSIDRIRIGLRSDGNSGTAWFDDISLARMPPEEPWFTGLPTGPSRGPVSAKGGNLVDGSGRRIRLWGVNLVDEVGRGYREIEQIAHRIKRMGFNAVRLHLYDTRLIDPDAVNEYGEPTSLTFRTAARGDGSVLDRFDYAVYCLEREGLYLYLTADRLRAAFKSGDYRALPESSPQDREAWQAAVVAANEEDADELLPYFDERIAAAQERYLRQMLDHRNPYTGMRVADDPWVALWELTNENGFVRAMVEGEHREWHPYMQATLRRRLKEWLLNKYPDETALTAAWGGLEEGESLTDATIAVEPCNDNRNRYADQRCEDIRSFMYDLFINYSTRLERVVHEAGSVSSRTVVSWDTVFEHKHSWYYAASPGSCMAVGTYVHEGPAEGTSNTHLSRPPEDCWYCLSYATVADKPTVIYESNVFRPCPYRAAYPIRMAALASWQDWDGVFFYVWSDGTVKYQDDPETYVSAGLRYEATSHVWHGIVFSTDEMFLAGARLAGEAFKNFHLPTAPDPVRVTIGRKDLLRGHLWIGDIGLPVPGRTRGKYPRANALAATAFRHGLEFQYDMDQEETVSSRPLSPASESPLLPVPGLIYDWDKVKLIIDTPAAKIAAGFLAEEGFGDGVRFEIDKPEFAVVGLVSTTGEPLSGSPAALFVATSTGENMGAVIEPGEGVPYGRIAKSWGHGPIQADRVHGTFRFGRDWEFRLQDFLFRDLKHGNGDSLQLRGEPMFAVELVPSPLPQSNSR